jgi:hypothetical protein
MGVVADFFTGSGSGFDVEAVGKTGFVYHVGENEFSHGGTADIAVADE